MDSIAGMVRNEYGYVHQITRLYRSTDFIRRESSTRLYDFTWVLKLWITLVWFKDAKSKHNWWGLQPIVSSKFFITLIQTECLISSLWTPTGCLNCWMWTLYAWIILWFFLEKFKLQNTYHQFSLCETDKQEGVEGRERKWGRRRC